ncbi:hypothetical protein QTO34_013144 [Cnephaeus nilssonii]|uniref:VWFA domain-containing protein n=1 Tax=Cnephaeus nilssonii TaxID=3371016 RepID=A0AA40I8I6_CNENI|nr:hypothetical protein QTO34_013144 [Eptesicus nilssonii]
MAASGVCVEDRTAPQPGPLPRFHCLTLASLSQRLRGAEAQPSAEDDSRAWLSAHSLEFEKLTVADLVSQGAPVLEEGGSAVDVHFSPRPPAGWSRSSLSVWPPPGGRRGAPRGRGRPGRGPSEEEFLRDLASLIDEQLSHKEKLFVLTFGTTTSALWPDPVDVSASSLQELKLWVRTPQPEGGSNLLQALRKTFALKGLDSLVTILGSCPDQPPEILSDYIQQATLGRGLHTHLVTYQCEDRVPPAVLKNLAEAVGGRYHCYSPESEICASPDIEELLAEMQKAQSLLGQVRALHQSAACPELPGLMEEISTEIAKGPFRGLLPKPPKHEAPLTIEFPNLDKTSAEWLKVNGLRAKKLSLYQVLAPNAFAPIEEFVPILQKTVSSTIHEKAMVQLQWHDGTVRNVHVDLPFLSEYQKQLSRAMRMYERRIEWLSLASRRIWGTVCEKRLVILLDLSAASSMYIIHIQHSLRLLLEEQLANKDAFNVIAFGSAVESWRPEMVSVSRDSLQSAWQWALTLQCRGSRNVLGALRKAVEVDFKDKDRQQSQGIYLFTGGIPDQDMPTLSAYVAEACGGCDLQLNVCLFYVGEPPMDTTPPACYASRTDTAAAYREVTRAAAGRFHWFGDTGIYESDDINAIMSEMEKALNYSQKCAFLVSSLKNQSRKDLQRAALSTEKPKMLKQRSQPRRLCPSAPAAPSAARTSVRDGPDRERRPPRKAVTWCPLSGKAGIPPAAAQPAKEGPGAGRRETRTREAAAGNSEGKSEGAESGKPLACGNGTVTGQDSNAGYRKCPQGGGEEDSSALEWPRKDTVCSSQEVWVANYGLKTLKMEISSRISPTGTRRRLAGRPAAARSCSAFPRGEVKGVLGHIQWTPREIGAYITCLKKVVRCCVQRLQWLLSGSRRLFGTILEKRVCILLDTSGSMGPHLPQVKTELILLIWEQLRALGPAAVQDSAVETTDTARQEAAHWVTACELRAAPHVSLHGVEGLCLLTAGQRTQQQPSPTVALVMLTPPQWPRASGSEAHRPAGSARTPPLRAQGRAWWLSGLVPALSVPPSRAEGNFLRSLASLTGGRYHCLVGEDLVSHLHRLLGSLLRERDSMLPLFEGDDLRRLAQEITTARSLLWPAQSLRSRLQKKNYAEPKVVLV